MSVGILSWAATEKLWTNVAVEISYAPFTLTVLSSLTVIVPVALTVPQPPVSGIE